MSEYTYVEKPFLDQLAALDWEVIDQGASIPQDPAVSGRTSFKEVVLTERFHDPARRLQRRRVIDFARPWPRPG